MGAVVAASRIATLAGAAVAALSLFAGAAQAATISGSFNGRTWTATSSIVGVTPTSTLSSNGDPRYAPVRPFQNGVAALIMDYGAQGQFICSGSLLSDRRSILTAGHCVSDGPNKVNPIKTTAYFYGGSDPDTIVYLSPSSTAIDVSKVFVNPDYTGEIIDQNDIAVLRLSEAAPDWATSYGLFTGPLDKEVFNVAGYGRRSNVGGDIGANLGSGRLRSGFNTYDFELGDPAFGGLFVNGFFGTADVTHSWVSDFDNGLAANDGSCVLSVSGFGNAPTPQFCDRGLGLDEVSVAGGDSGGPQFVHGKIASVTSYGLSFGADFGDVDNALNSSFGEFNGFVPVSLHQEFIRGAMVPEPATWALMIGGFGMLGGRMRRRRAVAA